MAKTLKAKLELDTRSAKRNVDDITGKMKGAGKEGKSAFGGITGSVKGLTGALGLGAGLAGGLTAVYALMRQVYEQQVRINQATEEAYRIQQQRVRAGAAELGGQLYREVRDVTGWTPQEARRRSLQAAMKYDVTPEGYLQAAKRIYSRVSAPQRPGAMRTAMTFATAYGTSGEAAGGALPVLAEQFGLTTQAEQRQGMAELGAVAQGSAYTSEQFTGILARTGQAGLAGGLSRRQQMAYAAGFSLFAPGEPQLTAMAIKQISTLADPRMRKPMMRRLLSAAGKDPNSRNVDDMRLAVAKYVNEGGDPDKLAIGLDLPVRVARLLGQTSSKAFAEKYKESIAAAQGTSWAVVEKRFQENVGAGTGFQERRAGYAGQLSATEMGAPGTALEAQQILGRAESYVQGRAGYQAGLLGFQEKVLADQGLDDPPSEQQMARLYRLNQIEPGVITRLSAIQNAGRDSAIASEAGHQIRLVETAKKNANEWHWFGKQADYIDAYAKAIREAIQFLRTTKLGQEPSKVHGMFEFERKEIRLTPTSSESKAAGGGIIPELTPDTTTSTQESGPQASIINIGVNYGRPWGGPGGYAENEHTRMLV